MKVFESKLHCFVLLGLIALHPLLMSQSKAEESDATQFERVPVTDPAELERFGYPENAQNIFKLVDQDGELVGREVSDEQRAELQGVLPFANDYAIHAGFEFQPLTHTYEYLKGPSFLILNGAVVSLLDSLVTFEVQIQMPGATTMNWFDVWGFHNSSGDELRLSLVSRCTDGLSAGNPVETVLTSWTVTDRDGDFREGRNLFDAPVDRQNCSYHARAVFDPDVGEPGVLLQLTKVRVDYDIPVSPLIFRDRFEAPM